MTMPEGQQETTNKLHRNYDPGLLDDDGASAVDLLLDDRFMNDVGSEFSLSNDDETFFSDIEPSGSEHDTSSRVASAAMQAAHDGKSSSSQHEIDEECTPIVDPMMVHYHLEENDGASLSDSDGDNSPSYISRPSQRLSCLPFPMKLHCLLMANQYPLIISWSSNRMSFVVHDLVEFESTVMPQYFAKEHKLSSFRRQLERYHFHVKGTFSASGKKGMIVSHEHFVKSDYNSSIEVCMDKKGSHSKQQELSGDHVKT